MALISIQRRQSEAAAPQPRAVNQLRKGFAAHTRSAELLALQTLGNTEPLRVSEMSLRESGKCKHADPGRGGPEIAS